MLGKRNAAAAPKRGEFTTILDEGAAIEGKFSFSGSVLLNGRLHGEIVSNDTLVIGEKGVVNANIHAGFVQISGEVVGDVYALERVELCATARVYGDVEGPVVVIEDGAAFEGHCRMSKVRAPEPAMAGSRDASIVPLKRIEPPA